MKKSYPIIVLLFVTSFAVDASLYAPYQAPKILLYVAVPLAMLVFAGLLSLVRKRELKITISIIEVLLLAELLWDVIGNRSLLEHTANLELFSLVAFVLVALIGRQINGELRSDKVNGAGTTGKSSLMLVMRAVWIVGVFQALIGFAQYLTLFTWLPVGTGKTRMIGLVGAANGYGTLMALSVMAIIVEIVRTRSVKNRIAFLAAAALPLTALVLNGSRAALLALVASGLVFFWIERQQWKALRSDKRTEAETVSPGIGKSGSRPLIAAVAIVLLFGGLSSYLYFYNVQSSRGRLFVWRVSAPMFLEHPVAGIGVGNYSIEYLDYQKAFFHDPRNLPLAFKASNMKQALSNYVQAFCESGFVGGMLFIAVFGMALWSFLFNGKKDIMLVGAGSMLLIIMIHMAMDTPLRIVPVSVIAASLLGFAPVRSDRVWHFRIRPGIRAVLLFLPVAAAAVFVAGKCERYYAGHLYWLRGYEFNLQHRWQFAEQEYNKALDYLPDDGELLFNLGGVQIIRNSYSKGIYHLQEARASFNDRNIYLSLSEGYLALHDYRRARHYARIALEMFPDQLSPHLLLGEIYYETGEFKKSKKSLRSCIDGDTSIRSEEVEQISSDAARLWKQYYGNQTERTVPQ